MWKPQAGGKARDGTQNAVLLNGEQMALVLLAPRQTVVETMSVNWEEWSCQVWAPLDLDDG